MDWELEGRPEENGTVVARRSLASMERNFFGPDGDPNHLQCTGSQVRLWWLEQFWPLFRMDFVWLEQWARGLEGWQRPVQRKDDSNMELSPDAITGLQGPMEGINKLEFLGFVLAQEPTRRGTSGVGGRRRRLSWAFARRR